jgi:uncharacterized peroxidase-related enzyme
MDSEFLINHEVLKEPEHKALSEQIESGLAVMFVPAFFTTQLSHSISVTKGSWGLVSHVLTQGELPRVLKEMIFVAISNARKCQYCEVAHLAMCKMLGLSKESRDLLVTDIDSISPELTKEIIHFALKCALSPTELKDDDYQKIKDMGISDAELIEIIAMASCSVYANIMADGMKVKPDEAFYRL